MEQHHVTCQCSDFNHTFRLTFDPVDGDVYLDARLNFNDPWWKRIYNAVKYVFKRDTSYGHYDVTLLRVEEYNAIRDLLYRSELAKAAQLSRERKQRLIRG